MTTKLDQRSLGRTREPAARKSFQARELRAAGLALQDLHLVAEDEDLRLAVSLDTRRSQPEDAPGAM